MPQKFLKNFRAVKPAAFHARLAATGITKFRRQVGRLAAGRAPIGGWIVARNYDALRQHLRPPVWPNNWRNDCPNIVKRLLAPLIYW
jgi:hypothetical protein